MAAANAAEVATHEWVRQEIANQPKRMYEAAKLAAADQGSSAAAYVFIVLTIALFITGAVYAGLLIRDLHNETGASPNGVIAWRNTKMGRLTVIAPTICFGFVTLAIVIGLLVSSDTFILQNKNRIAFGMAVFALLMSILIYMVAIRTRTLGGNMT